jgi:putative nucleotidyltransferase with HDIG domain
MQIISVNQELTKLTAVDKELTTGKKCFDVFGSGEICPHCPVIVAIHSKQMQQNIKREITRTDKEIYIEQLAIPIFDSTGEVDYVIEVAVDATARVQLEQQNKRQFVQTISALAALLELRDNYTGSHSKGVQKLAIALATELGLVTEEIEVISIAAILHDIGKIGIPESILNKPGKLDPEEYQIIQRHPVIGYETLKEIDLLKNVAHIILDHHEHLDGKGYPSGKMSSDIGLASRILSVADVFEALTSDRIYRKALTVSNALQIIAEGKGTQFDEVVVGALERIAVDYK